MIQQRGLTLLDGESHALQDTLVYGSEDETILISWDKVDGVIECYVGPAKAYVPVARSGKPTVRMSRMEDLAVLAVRKKWASEETIRSLPHGRYTMEREDARKKSLESIKDWLGRLPK